MKHKRPEPIKDPAVIGVKPDPRPEPPKPDRGDGQAPPFSLSEIALVIAVLALVIAVGTALMKLP